MRREIVELLDCDEEFLDLLVNEELVRPLHAHSGEPDLFSGQELERIRLIHVLVRDLEVNLAGAEVIIRMRENMRRMEERFDKILEVLVNEIHRLR